MPKKSIQKKLIEWKVYRLKGSPAAFIGIVHAPGEKVALKAAIKQFCDHSRSVIESASMNVSPRPHSRRPEELHCYVIQRADCDPYLGDVDVDYGWGLFF